MSEEARPPVLEALSVSKRFGETTALTNASVQVMPGAVTCLLGDNGAGKSTLIKVLSGVVEPDAGHIRVNGEDVRFQTPRDALDRGIATVFQDLAVVPIMPIYRNFFLGREPGRWGGLLFDVSYAQREARTALARMGIQIRDVRRPMATLSGGERQCVAIAKATHFGANVLILDEPTSALGVREAAIVLEVIDEARGRGLGIIFITHNVHHALPVGDCFTVLQHGSVIANLDRSDKPSVDELVTLMSGEA